MWDAENFIEKARTALVEIVEDGSAATLPDALDSVPRDTGALAATGRIFKTRVTATSIISTMRFGGIKGINYAYFVEFRSRFLRKSLFKNEDGFVRNAEGKLKN